MEEVEAVRNGERGNEAFRAEPPYGEDTGGSRENEVYPQVSEIVRHK